MADQVYKVRDPSGKIREIKGPAGASDEEVIAQAKKLFAAPDEPQKQEADWMDKAAGSIPGRFAIGAASPFLGAAQAGMHVAEQNPLVVAAQLLGRKAGIDVPTAGGVDERFSHLKQMQDRGREASGSEGFDWASLVGGVMSPASLATGGIPAAGSWLGRVGQGAAIGAGYGATAPVTQGDYASEKRGQIGAGAAVGAAIPAVAPLTKPAKGLYHAVEPWLPGGVEAIERRTANTAAGSDKAAVINALKNPQQLVPGSIPTAGEAAVPAGSTEFAALQKVVTPQRPSEYANISSGQDAARINAIREVAGTPGQKETFEAMRRSVADELYEKAYQKGVDITRDPQTGTFLSKREIAGRKGEINNLLKRPAIRDAAKEAKILAQNEGIKIDPTGSVEGLHYMKRALDDKIKASEGNEQRILIALKERLLTTIDSLSPKYAEARQRFAEMSPPINQMQVGQYLEDKLVPALNEHGASASQRAGVYAQALRDAPGTIKKSTGFGRFENLDQVLDPRQMQAVEGVGADLGRKSAYEQQATLGREATLRQLGKQEHDVSVPPMLQRASMLARALLNRLQGKASEKVLNQLSLDMQDPREMARIMEGPNNAKRQALAEALKQLRNPALIGLPVTAAIMEGH